MFTTSIYKTKENQQTSQRSLDQKRHSCQPHRLQTRPCSQALLSLCSSFLSKGQGHPHFTGSGPRSRWGLRQLRLGAKQESPQRRLTKLKISLLKQLPGLPEVFRMNFDAGFFRKIWLQDPSNGCCLVSFIYLYKNLLTPELGVLVPYLCCCKRRSWC